MLKKLIQLANDLDQKGLTKEADLIDRLLQKVAVPNILFYPEDDGLLEWQSWMKKLITPIAVFSFDSEKLSAKDIGTFRKSFGQDDDADFEKGDYDIAVQPFSMFSGAKETNIIDIDEFSSRFPDFSKKLKEKLSSLNLNAKDIVVFLYNKKQIQVGQITFDRSPSYFMHDIFHFFEERNPEFAAKFIFKLKSFLYFALSFYKDSEDRSAASYSSASTAYSKFFSGLYSLETDAKADIFSLATKGELEKNLIVPDSVSFSGSVYVLREGGKQKIEEAFFELCPDIYGMISNAAEDPLEKYKGKVLLHDFIP